jgi:hypothetical protein
MAPGAWFDEPIRRLVAGRPVILVGGVPQAWTAELDTVRRAGARDVLVVATEGDGIGEAPDCPTVVVPRPDGLSVLERIRRGAEIQRDPPAEVVEAVERFDPEHRAVVLGTFLNESPSLLGRPHVSHRRPEWVHLEDKVVADELWDRCGVRRAPAEVVPIDQAPEAAHRLDAGAGTVWAGDATQGWHGGAAYVRWVTDDAEAEAAAALLGRRSRRVRVMPFLEGIPCSIHGIVLPDGVAVLRPVEMVTLRRRHDLFYAGCATYWDPPDEVRAAMRSAAAAVGNRLARTVGYRGAFTVDGVAAEEGFLPTELNPRAGAGLSAMARGLPERFPLMLLLELVSGGIDLGRTALEIEAELLHAADAARSGGTWRYGDLDPASFAGTLWRHSGGWSVEALDGAPSAAVQTGPGAARCLFRPDRWPVGPSVAPAAVDFYGWCDEHQVAGIGPLHAAVDVTAR